MVFSHIALTSENPFDLEKWYIENFGFKRARLIPLGDDNQIIFIKNNENVYLEIFKTEEKSPIADPEKDGYPFKGIRHIAFQVEDVDKTLARIKDANISLGPLGFDDFIPGWKTIWIKDPDGNIVEISQGFKDDESLK